MRKLVVCCLALGGVASAQAADLGSYKDPLPDTLSYAGVTLYGTVDVGYAYQNHGTPYSTSLATGLEDSIWGSRNVTKSISSLSNNGLEQSKIGVKIEEGIGYGWTAIGRVETGFNPLSGELSDGCASLVRNNGIPYQQQSSNGDSSRCGQAFNGEVYAGVSNASYGTLTVGRQNSLALNTAANYDPMSLSYAFSYLGYTGTGDGGAGVTELSRWDDAIKYVYQYGPVHVSGMYSDGGDNTGMFNGAYAGNAGFTWRGLSIDGVYTVERGAVAVAAPYQAPGFSTAPCYQTAPMGGLPSGTTLCSNDVLSGTISDNTSWQIDGKYTMELGGGWKDEAPASKLTFYGGYIHTNLANPKDIPPPGSGTIGGYTLTGIATTAYDTDKVLQTAWAGAKYETGPWAFIGAYYHVSQNSFDYKGSLCSSPYASNAGRATVGAQIPSECSGNFNQGAFVVDYTFNKHFDVYAGLSYTEIDGGLSSSYINTSQATFMSGLRLKF